MNEFKHNAVADRGVESSEGSRFNYKSLSALLRLSGAGVLVASLSVFLFQDWSGSADLYRFAMLLGFSSVLTVAGFAAGRLIGENISARLFLGLALLSVIVNFAVAGALVYSSYPAAEMLTGAYPSFAQWQDNSGQATLLAPLAALLILSPITWIGFRVLVRQCAGRFSVYFLLTNAVMLIPIRDTAFTALLVVMLAVPLIIRVRQIAERLPALATAEGQFAAALIFAPLLLVVARLLTFYAADAFAYMMFAALVYFALRQSTMAMPATSAVRRRLERVALLPAAVVALNFGELIAALLVGSGSQTAAVTLPVAVLSFSALMLELSMRAANTGPDLRRQAALVGSFGMAVNLMLFPSLPAAVIAFVAGLVTVTYGYSVQQKTIAACGFVSLAGGAAYQLWLVSTVFDPSSWTSLAALGMLAILSAALLERHGLALRDRIQRWRGQLADWDN